VVVNPSTPGEKRILKVNGMKVRSGDVIRVESGGGGGYGDPLERETEQVREDLLDGYIDRAHADSVYGARVLPGTEELNSEVFKVGATEG
jgi:N-methylhydantoinase B